METAMTTSKKSKKPKLKQRKMTPGELQRHTIFLKWGFGDSQFSDYNVRYEPPEEINPFNYHCSNCKREAQILVMNGYRKNSEWDYAQFCTLKCLDDYYFEGNDEDDNKDDVVTEIH